MCLPFHLKDTFYSTFEQPASLILFLRDYHEVKQGLLKGKHFTAMPVQLLNKLTANFPMGRRCVYCDTRTKRYSRKPLCLTVTGITGYLSVPAFHMNARDQTHVCLHSHLPRLQISTFLISFHFNHSQIESGKY